MVPRPPQLHLPAGHARPHRRRRRQRPPLRLHRRGRLRDRGPGRARGRPCGPRSRPTRGCSRSGSARATRCASRRGSASTATTSTRPRRRSRPASSGRSSRGAAVRAASAAPSGAARTCATAPRALRVGLKPAGRAPVRDGAPLYDAEAATAPIGRRHLRRIRPVARRAGRHGLCAAGAVVGRHAPVRGGAGPAAAGRRARASIRPQSLQTLIGEQMHVALFHPGTRVDRHQDGIATVGITDHAQAQLGELVFVELPQARPPRDEGRRRRGRRERQGRLGRLHAGQRRGGRSERRAGRAIRRASIPRPRAAPGCSSCASPARANSPA